MRPTKGGVRHRLDLVPERSVIVASPSPFARAAVDSGDEWIFELHKNS